MYHLNTRAGELPCSASSHFDTSEIGLFTLVWLIYSQSLISQNYFETKRNIRNTDRAHAYVYYLIPVQHKLRYRATYGRRKQRTFIDIEICLKYKYKNTKGVQTQIQYVADHFLLAYKIKK